MLVFGLLFEKSLLLDLVVSWLQITIVFDLWDQMSWAQQKPSLVAVVILQIHLSNRFLPFCCLYSLAGFSKYLDMFGFFSVVKHSCDL